jgi:hypothetical protein
MSESIFFEEEQSDALLDSLIEAKTVKSFKFLTKSKFLNGLQCPKLLWTRCNAPQEIPEISDQLQAIFDNGRRVGELATRCFPGGIRVQEEDFIKNLEEIRTLLGIKDPKPIYEAGIQSGRLYSRADILRPSAKAGMWDIIEVKCSTKCKDIYLQDIAYQRYCYEQAGILIDRCYLMHVDNTYVRHGDIDPDQFFILLDVTEEIKPFLIEIPNQVAGFLKIIDLPTCPNISIREYCNKPYECQMKPICWAYLPKYNVTQLSRGMSKRFELLEQNIVLLKDIPSSFKLSPNQQIQRNCAISGREFVDKEELGKFVKGLQYPIYFMDFETIFEVIPRFDGTRPYQQVPFQFSVHIQRVPGGETEHFSYLHKSDSDPRRDFVTALCKCIKNGGTVIVYNQNMEEGRLKELSEVFPEFEAACQSMRLRMIDLLVPFRSFYFYHSDQNGSASLKKVLPVLVGQGYKDLTIAEGMLASTEYVRVTFNENVSSGDRSRVYLDLEKYCALDTKAMVDILEALQKMT